MQKKSKNVDQKAGRTTCAESHHRASIHYPLQRPRRRLASLRQDKPPCDGRRLFAMCHPPRPARRGVGSIDRSRRLLFSSAFLRRAVGRSVPTPKSQSPIHLTGARRAACFTGWTPCCHGKRPARCICALARAGARGGGSVGSIHPSHQCTTGAGGPGAPAAPRHTHTCFPSTFSRASLLRGTVPHISSPRAPFSGFLWCRFPCVLVTTFRGTRRRRLWLRIAAACTRAAHGLTASNCRNRGCVA